MSWVRDDACLNRPERSFTDLSRRESLTMRIGMVREKAGKAIATEGGVAAIYYPTNLLLVPHCLTRNTTEYRIGGFVKSPTRARHLRKDIACSADMQH